MMNQIKILRLACGILFFTLYPKDFDNLWHEMQQGYVGIKECVNPAYMHHFWAETLRALQKNIMGKPDSLFLRIPQISGTMVRSNFGPMQSYELDYLRNHPSLRLSQYKDTDFGGTVVGFTLDNKNSWSANTLGHIFYIERILKYYRDQLDIILEIGGGYGNLARLFKQVFPRASYIIIDAPEILAIQWLFLKNTTDYNIELCNHIPEYFNGGIYLIPNTLLQDLSIKPSLLISNFALSECSFAMQKDVVEKKFFEASSLYITGQLENMWPEGWVSHEYLKSASKEIYRSVIFGPFQEGKSNDHSYELIAYN